MIRAPVPSQLTGGVWGMQMSHCIFALTSAVVVFAAVVSGCSIKTSDSDVQFTSDKSTLLNFEFNGEIIISSNQSIEVGIEEQLQYTIGQLNGDNSVGRLDALRIIAAKAEDIGDGSEQKRVSYRAVLPVAWGSKLKLPTAYQFRLPLNMSPVSLQQFVVKYAQTCVDLWSAHNPTTEDMWYYYRPQINSCKMDPADVSIMDAKVSFSAENRDGTYPEIDKIWEDGSLNVIVIFGKDIPGSTSNSDFGINQYDMFNVNLTRYALGLKLQPNPIPKKSAPGIENPDITWSGVTAEGRNVNVTTLLIDSPQMTTAAFDEKYRHLTPNADIIIYNGHAALGDNVRALTQKGTWIKGKYLIFSVMGCDSFAYVDGSLAKARFEVNPDDPSGTKYLDIITNNLPANPTWLSQAAVSLITGVINPQKPYTYQSILKGFERNHSAVVTGDEDNSFRP